jgi:hypothetical protein
MILGNCYNLNTVTIDKLVAAFEDKILLLQQLNNTIASTPTPPQKSNTGKTAMKESGSALTEIKNQNYHLAKYLIQNGCDINDGEVCIILFFFLLKEALFVRHMDFYEVFQVHLKHLQ